MNHGDRPRAATRIGRVVACLAVAGAMVASLARAQDGGLTGFIDFSGGLRFVENSASNSTGTSGLDSRIGFGLTSTTKSQRLAFQIDGNIRSEDGGIGVRPTASLDYALSNRSTELSFGATYRQEEVEGSELILDDFFTPELIADNGIRRTATANLRLVTGKDRRFGTDTRLDYSDRRYTDTADPDLLDTERWTASTTLRFDLSSTVSMRLTGSYTERTVFDAPERQDTTRRIGIGADFLPDALWRLSADIGFADIETERSDGLGGLLTDDFRGGEGSLSATRTMENGSLTFRAGHQLSTSGGRTNVSVGRSLTLKTVTLDGTIGLVRFDSGDISSTLQLAYAQELPRGAALNVTASRSGSTNLDDQSIIRSQVAATYSQPLTAVSSWSVSGSLARIEVVDSGDGATSQVSLGLNYNHKLTSDWGLAIGVQARRSYEDGDERSHSNVLSASLQRRFTFRP